MQGLGVSSFGRNLVLLMDAAVPLTGSSRYMFSMVLPKPQSKHARPQSPHPKPPKPLTAIALSQNGELRVFTQVDWVLVGYNSTFFLYETLNPNP